MKLRDRIEQRIDEVSEGMRRMQLAERLGVAGSAHALPIAAQSECPLCLEWINLYVPQYTCTAKQNKASAALPNVCGKTLGDLFPKEMRMRLSGRLNSVHNSGIELRTEQDAASPNIVGFCFSSHALGVFQRIKATAESYHTDVMWFISHDTVAGLLAALRQCALGQRPVDEVVVTGLLVSFFVLNMSKKVREEAVKWMLQVCYVWCTSTNTRLCALADLLIERCGSRVDAIELAPPFDEEDSEDDEDDNYMLYFPTEPLRLPRHYLVAMREEIPRGFRQSEVELLVAALSRWVDRRGGIEMEGGAEQQFRMLVARQCLVSGTRRLYQKSHPVKKDLRTLPQHGHYEVNSMKKALPYTWGTILSATEVPIYRHSRGAAGLPRRVQVLLKDYSNAGAVQQQEQEFEAIDAVDMPVRRTVADMGLLVTFRVMFVAHTRTEFANHYFHPLLWSANHIHDISVGVDAFRLQEAEVDRTGYSDDPAQRLRKRIRGAVIREQQAPVIVSHSVDGSLNIKYRLVVKSRQEPVHIYWSYDTLAEALCAWLVYVRDFNKGELERGFRIDSFLQDILAQEEQEQEQEEKEDDLMQSCWD